MTPNEYQKAAARTINIYLTNTGMEHHALIKDMENLIKIILRKR